MVKVIKVLDTVVFSTCIVRKEIVSNGWDGYYPPTTWKAAYSLVDGSYIGDAKDADFFEKNGIIPEAIPGNSVASIGFCEKEQKWYGWSHRATYGFGIGSKIKKGDCGYRPIDPQDLLDDMINFWNHDEDEYVTKTKIIKQQIGVTDPDEYQKGLGVLIEKERMRKKDKVVLKSTYWTPYPEKWGRGEWEAKTLDDAKEMAISFARGVS